MIRRELLVASLCLGLVGCDLLDESEFPKGTSTLSAHVNGSLRSFANIHASNYIDGFKVVASYQGDTVRLSMADGNVGQYTWRAPTSPTPWVDTVAFYNSFQALPGVGGFTISEHDHTILKAAGTFEFTAIDTLNADTLRVTGGQFVVFYEPTD